MECSYHHIDRPETEWVPISPSDDDGRSPPTHKPCHPRTAVNASFGTSQHNRYRDNKRRLTGHCDTTSPVSVSLVSRGAPSALGTTTSCLAFGVNTDTSASDTVPFSLSSLSRHLMVLIVSGTVDISICICATSSPRVGDESVGSVLTFPVYRERADLTAGVSPMHTTRLKFALLMMWRPIRNALMLNLKLNLSRQSTKFSNMR
mmetsp:Transcript_22685/g.59827  ORF Transcript_22685/g.59827 Transcript_22685/m.59827 type:complete len:204 (+) Transcript_22685:110-721(+)